MKVILKVLGVAGIGLALLAGCTDSEGSDSGQEPEPDVEVDEGSGSGSLDPSEACAEFTEVITDFTLGDAESAAELGELASRTSDPELAAAIQSVADAFARSDPEIFSTEVDALCT